MMYQNWISAGQSGLSRKKIYVSLPCGTNHHIYLLLLAFVINESFGRDFFERIEVRRDFVRGQRFQKAVARLTKSQEIFSHCIGCGTHRWTPTANFKCFGYDALHNIRAVAQLSPHFFQ